MAIPLLVVQAADDPIAPAEAIPRQALAANPNCLLVVTPSGGHLGWCSGRDGARGEARGVPLRVDTQCWQDFCTRPEVLTTGASPAAGPPWTDPGVSEYFTACRQLLAQRELAGERPQAEDRPRPAEAAGVFTAEETTHQAP